MKINTRIEKYDDKTRTLTLWYKRLFIYIILQVPIYAKTINEAILEVNEHVNTFLFNKKETIIPITKTLKKPKFLKEER